MNFRALPLLLSATLVLSACGNHGGDDVQVFGGDTDVINSHVTLKDGKVVVRASGEPDAVIDTSGSLSIGGKDVAVNDAQRALLQRYNGAAKTMRDHAIATGMAGVTTASKELGAVAGKLTGADSAEETRTKAEAAAQNVEQAAAKICDDIADMKTAQDALATQLDAFKPYASALTDDNVTQCRKGTKH